VPDWRIGGATHEQVASVLALWRAADAPPTVGENPQALSVLLHTDGDALLVAEVDGAVVGSLIAGWDGWRGSFYRLAVHPDRRRQGLGTALLREGERRLLERGAARLTAIVIDDDPAALEFWLAAGYSRQRHRARFIRSAEE
jgi:ribosomal protein S18 acetylase RimI-like enzyme